MEYMGYITLLTIQPRDSGILGLLQIKVTYSQPIGEIHVMEASKRKNRKKSPNSRPHCSFPRNKM
jgi:hypothetical protein